VSHAAPPLTEHEKQLSRRIAATQLRQIAKAIEAGYIDRVSRVEWAEGDAEVVTECRFTQAINFIRSKIKLDPPKRKTDPPTSGVREL